MTGRKAVLIHGHSSLCLLVCLSFAASAPAVMAQRGAPPKAAKAPAAPLTPDQLLDQADALNVKDKPGSARPLILRALKMRPNDSRALRLLGDCYFYDDLEGVHHPEARQCYEKALRIDPQNSIAYRMLAELALVDGKFQTAVAYATNALTCKEPTEYALRTRAVAYHNLHKYNEALRDMNEFLSKHGGTGDTKAKWLMIKAGMLEDARRYDEAVATIKQVLAMRWIDDVALKLAQCYVKAGKPNDAIATLGTIIAKNPDDEFAYSERAKVRVSIKQYKEALSDYNKSIELGPLSRTYKERAALYTILGMKAEAKRDIEKADEM